MTVSFGVRLKALREEAGLTQEALAEQLHVTRQAVSGWERGRSEPDIATLQQLAGLFSLTVDELLSGVESQTPTETLRGAGRAMLWLGLGFTAVAGWGAVAGRGVMPLVLCTTLCAVAGLLVWFALSAAIKTGDTSMLAGFDPAARYNLPALRRQLDALRFWYATSTTVAMVPLLLAFIWPIPMNFSFVVLVLVSFLLCVLVGFGVIDYRLGPVAAPDALRISRKPLAWFLSALLCTLGCVALAVDGFGVQNNTPPAMALAALLFLACAVQIACFCISLHGARRAGREKRPYRLHPVVLAGYIVSFGLAAAMVLVVARP